MWFPQRFQHEQSIPTENYAFPPRSSSSDSWRDCSPDVTQSHFSAYQDGGDSETPSENITVTGKKPKGGSKSHVPKNVINDFSTGPTAVEPVGQPWTEEDGRAQSVCWNLFRRIAEIGVEGATLQEKISKCSKPGFPCVDFDVEEGRRKLKELNEELDALKPRWDSMDCWERFFKHPPAEDLGSGIFSH